ncbi:MAG: L-seryl-tRNA(Sec) selenium transferase, partial [Candidatus Methylomirabilaceae bacterium]
MVVVSGHDWRRLIPATDVLLRAPRLQEAVAVHGRAAVKREIHEVQRIIRETRISLEEL